MDFFIDKKIPYRLHFGKNKFDWVDIYRIIWLDDKGNITVQFEDKSPIRRIYQNEIGQYLLITKNKSEWYFSYRGNSTDDYFLKKLPPNEYIWYLENNHGRLKLIYIKNGNNP
mgnify:FL=1